MNAKAFTVSLIQSMVSMLRQICQLLLQLHSMCSHYHKSGWAIMEMALWSPTVFTKGISREIKVCERANAEGQDRKVSIFQVYKRVQSQIYTCKREKSNSATDFLHRCCEQCFCVCVCECLCVRLSYRDYDQGLSVTLFCFVQVYVAAL